MPRGFFISCWQAPVCHVWCSIGRRKTRWGTERINFRAEEASTCLMVIVAFTPGPYYAKCNHVLQQAVSVQDNHIRTIVATALTIPCHFFVQSECDLPDLNSPCHHSTVDCSSVQQIETWTIESIKWLCQRWNPLCLNGSRYSSFTLFKQLKHKKNLNKVLPLAGYWLLKQYFIKTRVPIFRCEDVCNYKRRQYIQRVLLRCLS